MLVKRVKKVLISLMILSMCCIVPIEANQDSIPYKIGTTYPQTKFSLDKPSIYEFTLKKASVIKVRADFKFQDIKEKEIGFEIINQKCVDALKQMVEKPKDIVITKYGKTKITNKKDYKLNEYYYLKAGTYRFEIITKVLLDELPNKKTPLKGSVEFTLSDVNKDKVTVQEVSFKYTKSQWGSEPKPLDITYVRGSDVPISYYSLSRYPQLERENYYLLGHYAYRKRDNTWLYAKEYYVNEEYVEYRNFGWYPLNKAPKGYERYIVRNDDLGSDIFKMDTMRNHDQILLREVWEGYEYFIRYHGEGAKGTMKNTYLHYGETKNLRENNYTYKNKSFVGWRCYRASDNKWLYTNGKQKAWYRAGKAPKGWQKYIFENKESIKNLATKEFQVIHMYATWKTMRS